LHILTESIPSNVKGQPFRYNELIRADSKSHIWELQFKSLAPWAKYEQMIDLLISHGADINARDGGGNTPLFAAVENGSAELVELLIKKGADVNARNDEIKTMSFDPEGETPLHRASRLGQRKVVDLLISNGANINSTDKFGRTPLYYAFWEGKKDIVDLLIKSGAKIPKTAGEEIYDAILADDVRAVEALIDKEPGIVNIKKHNRDLMPLHLASAINRERIADLLISRGADANARDSLEAWGSRGWTPLHWASYNDSAEVLLLLIKNGAKVNSVDRFNNTPIGIASAEGHQRAVECLISGGAVLSSADAHGQTPLHMAAMNNQGEMIELLLKKGADKNAKCKSRGSTPLCDAVILNQRGAIDVLVRNNASLVIGQGSDIYNAIILGDADEAANFICNNPLAIDNADSDQGWTPLHCAAIAGNVEIAKFLIDQGAEPDKKDFWGLTPLFWAIRSGSGELVKLLLESGSDIHIKDSQGFTPIRWAEQMHDREVLKIINAHAGKFDIWSLVKKGEYESVKTMLKKNPMLVNSKDTDGRTPLHMAVAGDLKGMSDILVSSGANVNERDRSGNTPLHFAAGKKSGVLVEMLLKNGADVNDRNNAEETPLHKASSMAVCRHLLSKGALVNAKDINGYTPIHTISRQGTRAMVELLLSRGASLNESDNSCGRNPLCMAASAGNVELVKFYVEKGGNVNIPEKKNPWRSPLYLAVQADNERLSLEVVKFLILKGADVNYRDSSGYPVITEAAESGRNEVVSTLISNGAIVNVKPDNGQTPLYTALNCGYKKRLVNIYDPRTGVYSVYLYPRSMKSADAYKKTIELLLERGADVNMKNGDGLTVLHLVSALGWEEMLSALIDRGAKIDDRDEMLHYTPLHYAAGWGGPAVVELLLSKGADVNARDRNNKTPLKLASEHSQIDVIKLLRAYGGAE